MKDLFYKKVGQGKALVFLHGLLGFHRNFHSIALALEKDYESLLYDQRFHGRSVKEGPFTLERLALDLKELLDHLGLKKIYLVGHSLGGYVGAYFTHLYQDYVEKLVIVDSNPWPKKERFEEIETMLKLLPSSFKSREEMEAFFEEKVEKGEIVRRMAGFLKASIDRGTLSFVFNPPDILKLLEDTRRVKPLPVLEKITSPTLILRGERSNYFESEEFLRLKSLNLKNYSLLEIKGAAHWIHSDKPLEFKKALLQFFSS